MASVKKRAGYGYEVRYIDPATGKRPSKTFELKKDADAYKRKVEREIEDGTHTTATASLTVADVCSRYLRASEDRRQRSEIGATRLIEIAIFIDKHIVPNLGGKVLRDLKPGDIDDLYATMTRTVSPFYARQILGNFATMERWAVRQEYLRVTPVANALRGIKRPPRPRIEEFTAEQASLLLKHTLSRTGPRARYAAMIACYVHLAACCGLRLGEICALDRASVDLDAKRLRIRRNRTCLGELKGPKSKAGNRDVPIPDHLCEMLRRWLDSYFEASEENYVFTTYDGNPIGATNFRYGWHYLLKEVGLYRPGAIFHFHALRHFAGSWWLENTMPIQDVALQLGHASAATTLSIYAHTVSKIADRQQAMTQMGRILLPGSDAPLPQNALSH